MLKNQASERCVRMRNGGHLKKKSVVYCGLTVPLGIGIGRTSLGIEPWSTPTTNHKGSEILRALSLGRIPRVARGFGLECCGWRALKTLGIFHFLGQSRLFSLFGLRVGAGGGRAKSTGYMHQFIVN
jgi:hypothetical protein